MSVHGFLLVLTAASALLAAWLVVRFPRLARVDGRSVAVAIAGAALVVAGVPAAIPLVGRPLGAPVAVLAVALPGFVYVFLVVAWVMLFFRRALAPYL